MIQVFDYPKTKYLQVFQIESYDFQAVRILHNCDYITFNYL